MKALIYAYRSNVNKSTRTKFSMHGIRPRWYKVGYKWYPRNVGLGEYGYLLNSISFNGNEVFFDISAGYFVDTKTLDTRFSINMIWRKGEHTFLDGALPHPILCRLVALAREIRWCTYARWCVSGIEDDFIENWLRSGLTIPNFREQNRAKIISKRYGF